MTPAAERRPRFAAWLAEPMLASRDTYLKVAIAAAVINLFGIVTSLFTMTVYDRVLPNNATASLIALSIGLAIVLVFDFILRTLRAYFMDVAGARIDQEVGETVFARLLALRMDARTGPTGALAGLMRELETLRDFFASVTLTALVDVPFILLTLAVLALIGGPVVLVPLAMVPLVILAGWLTEPALERLSARAMNETLVKQAVLVEAIGGIETVKTSNAGALLSERWRDSLERHSALSLRQRLVGAIAVNIAVIANTVAYAGVVIVGVGLIADERLTMGGLVACSILAGRAVAPLGQIAQLLSRLNQTRAAYRQINALMANPPEGPAGQALALAALKGRVEFRGVAFRYPGQAERALDGVSFSIAPGERVALLGRMGSGKSTVARLVMGLYEPEDGLVLVDGSDVRQLDPAALRAQIGAVLQNTVLLSGTVRENIVLGRDIDDAAMLRASEIAGVHAFIGQVANGYELRLADRGESLSGGQRQAIALARALADQPALYVFDEPTSAMDAQTEAALIDRLDVALKGRTVLLVTHRPAMLKLVERVIVLDRGKIVADGPRDAVLARAQRPKAAA